MIFIEDYRDLSRYYAPVACVSESEYLGQSVTVTTSAGTSYTGIMIENSPGTITVAHRRRSGQDGRRVIIAKAHIVAIETGLE